MRNPLRRRSSASGRRETVHITMSEPEMIAFGMRLTADRAAELVAVNRLEEAVDIYAEDVRVCRAVVEAAKAAEAAIGPDAMRAVNLRVAVSLHNMGALEGKLGRAESALEDTAEAVSIYRRFDDGDPAIREGLAGALHSFALAREAVRREMPEGAQAATEALEVVKALPQPPDGSMTSAQAQIELTLHMLTSLIEWIEQGSQPDDEPMRPRHPGPLDWREELYLGMLERLEVPELLKQARTVAEATAVLRWADLRGDAEAARKFGDLLEAGGDLDSAEAAYARGAARGSQEAAVRLDQLRQKRDLARRSQ